MFRTFFFIGAELEGGILNQKFAYYSKIPFEWKQIAGATKTQCMREACDWVDARRNKQSKWNNGKLLLIRWLTFRLTYFWIVSHQAEPPNAHAQTNIYTIDIPRTKKQTRRESSMVAISLFLSFSIVCRAIT